MASNNMKIHLICNTIKVVAGIGVIGYVCKMTRSPWPLLAMMFIPTSNYSTGTEERPVNNVSTKNKEESPNE